MIGATILFTISGIILLFSIIAWVYTQVPEWLLTIIISIVLSIIGLVILKSTPRNIHVSKGKAHYVEQNHIEVVNGDTINNYKTYQIVWNK